MAESSNTPSGVPSKNEGETKMKIYNAGALIIEILMLFLKMGFTYIEALYRLIIPNEKKDVKGEIVLITGFGDGIGQELSIQFAAMGNTVVCVDINDKVNTETARIIKSRSGEAFAYTCDISNCAAVIKMAAKIQQEVGEISVLVINTGILGCRSHFNSSGPEIRKVFDVNVCGHIWLLQAFLPSMISRNHGHIVGVSPMGLTDMMTYSVTSTMRGIMESLHEELREDQRKIDINFTLVLHYTADSGINQRNVSRFQSLVKRQTPKSTAEHVIKKMRQNALEVSFPQALMPLIRISRAVPSKICTLIKDFFCTGL